MMGEFILYYRGKIIGGIYDDRLLVKKTKSAFVPACDMRDSALICAKLRKHTASEVFSLPLDNLSFGSYNDGRNYFRQEENGRLEKGNTKREILETALELFSVKGYEATSIAQIAEAVGIRKASLYSHFGSKQEILDALEQEVLEEYNSRSIFARADWDETAFAEDVQDMTPEAAAQLVCGQVRYILHDPRIRQARKMLTVEQFRNPKLAELQTRQNYTNVMRYFTRLIRFFISRGRLRENDPEIMAAQFCLPISVWINLCDREAEREREVMELIERHIRQFFKLYGTEQEKTPPRELPQEER